MNIPEASGKRRRNVRERHVIRLNPKIYKAFRVFCKVYDYGKPNILIESFMLSCVLNPALPLLIKSIADEDQ